ncbi:MAG: hypothetical protein ACR2LC_04770 [Pyrinomonadaceae bacterium]
MNVREDLLNTIRALPLAEQQALLDELAAVVNREKRGDIADPQAQSPMDGETADVTDADRVLGMWRNRFDDAETSGDIANRWRRESWQR